MNTLLNFQIGLLWLFAAVGLMAIPQLFLTRARIKENERLKKNLEKAMCDQVQTKEEQDEYKNFGIRFAKELAKSSLEVTRLEGIEKDLLDKICHLSAHVLDLTNELKACKQIREQHSVTIGQLNTELHNLSNASH